jgi:hypothetical protein
MEALSFYEGAFFDSQSTVMIEKLRVSNKAFRMHKRTQHAVPSNQSGIYLKCGLCQLSRVVNFC